MDSGILLLAIPKLVIFGLLTLGMIQSNRAVRRNGRARAEAREMIAAAARPEPVPSEPAAPRAPARVLEPVDG